MQNSRTENIWGIFGPHADIWTACQPRRCRTRICQGALWEELAGQVGILIKMFRTLRNRRGKNLITKTRLFLQQQATDASKSFQSP